MRFVTLRVNDKKAMILIFRKRCVFVYEAYIKARVLFPSIMISGMMTMV